jgi:hypothetical protein
MDDVRLFQAIQERAKKELVPKLRVGPKSAFAIHKLINFILNLTYPKDRKDAYLKQYNTTIGFTVAMAQNVGDNSDSFGNWRTLCHEIKHAQQAKKWTRLLFGALYLFPISLGVVLLLVGWVGVIWIPGWWKAVYLVSWLAATGIMFIPQLPDPWRKRWEFQAYSISMHLRFLVFKGIDSEYVESLVNNFHSMMYYIMAPNEDKIRKELNTLRVQILMGRSPVKDEPIVKLAEEEYAKLLGRS